MVYIYVVVPSIWGCAMIPQQISGKMKTVVGSAALHTLDVLDTASWHSTLPAFILQQGTAN